jgi:DNA polymerase-3 subunit delta'
VISPGSTDWGVVGHDAAVELMRRQIVSGRIRHATLVTGPAGVGKRTFVNATLKALNCMAPPAPGAFCGGCRSCQKIERGVHPDIQRFDLDSQAAVSAKKGGQNRTITIDTARDVRSSVATRPTEGRWRAVIIDDAETLAETAQEALLKTLEEPPPSMLLFLLSDDSEALLPTIRSRCQVIDLRPVRREAIEALLIQRGAKADSAESLARMAQGRPGWALNALAKPAMAKQHLADVEEAVTWLTANPYHRLVTGIKLADRFGKSRTETFERLGTLQTLWRDLLLIGSGLPERITYLTASERLSTLARTWTLSDLNRGNTAVQTCISDLEANVRPRLAIETMVLQWPNP